MSTLEARTGVTAPPTGNGAPSGLGEAFSINHNTGQGVYSYKLALPNGRAGHGAKLALEYSHGAGLGPFGLGWRLGVRSISRRLDFGTETERWLDGGQELVETPDGSFAAAREGAFTRYRRSGDGWMVEERSGIVHECGLTEAARVADPDHADRVQEWLVERTLDPSGNAIEHAYERDGDVAYPASVRWAAYELRFVYEERPDVRRDARAGFLRTHARRCSAIELYVDPGTEDERRVRSWALTYRQDPACGVSLLTAIRLTSHGAAADGSQDAARPLVRLGYAGFDPASARVSFIEAPEGAEPPALDAPDTALVTLDRAPLPGVLQVVNGEQLYWPNRGDGRWGEPRPVAETPTIDSFGDSGVLFADADGSATADMIVAGNQPLHGYFENGGNEGWSRFVAYPSGHAAAPPWSSGQVRLMDADGDGRVDAIASDTTAFTVWRNGGPDGWSSPEIRPIDDGDGPAGVDFADPLVHLADMTGDGLDDIVRIASGRVEYWPGLGDGKFGARVVMGSSPRLRDLSADPESVVLVDVDGDGCADLVRVSGTNVDVAMNRSGREFGRPVRIGPVPAPLPGTLRPANMKGHAGAGLLWCSLRFGSPAYVQLEFAPEAPPYVLTSVDNGSGLRSELTYRSAVDDYLRDFDDGELWTTNLPFPLTVVASTREIDRVSGQETVVEYSYHEGHFAPSTRQFQGFRRTDRLERGDESRPDTLVVSHYLMDQERVPGNGPEHVELNGMLARVETFALDGTADEGRPYRVEESEYQLRLLPAAPGAARERSLVTVTAHRTEDRERTDDVRGEEKTYEYDANGNVVRETTRGYGTRDGAPQPERVLVTEVEYATGDRHLLDRPARIVERDGGGRLLREQRRYYDGPGFEGLPLGELDRGLVVREEELVLSEQEFGAHYKGTDPADLGYHAGTDADGNPAVMANTGRCAYDARGVKTGSRDALGHEETYGYDPDGLFRTSVADSLGETRYEFDRATGQATAIEYPDGRVARFEYDAQGRLLSRLLPGDDPGAPPRTYAYADKTFPNARMVTFRSSPDPGGTSRAITYFDGHGREFQQRVEAEPGRVLVSAVELRNPWGDVRREYEPRDATSLAFRRPDVALRPSRAVRYDARGRVVESTGHDGAVSRAEYRPFEVILQDPDRAGTPRREEFDVLRTRTRVVQELGDGETATTSFEVDARGDLLAVRDDSGVLCRCAYDRAGRRLVADHREGGRRRIFYDARGATVGSLDAAGNELRAELDAHGRLLRLTLDGETVEELTYDDDARNAFGRLASTTYPGGRQDFTYDDGGRIVRHDYAFDGAERTETLAYEYDALGRETAVTHTDGRRIERVLTLNGWVKAIPGIVDEVAYDARGLPTSMRYANGVVTDIGYGPGPGRVRSQRTRGPAGQVLHDVGYERDGLGLVTRTDDATPGGAGVREFAYDPLLQLREVTENGAPAIGYAYDRHFNLAGLGDTGATLHHDDPGRAYRLTGVTAPGGALEAIDHDGNGNVSGHGGRRFVYDYKQALTRFEDGAGLVAEYGYDPFGARVSKVVDDGSGGVTRTFFLGEEAEVRDGTPTLFARIGELRVAIVTPNSTRYVHPDPLGTTAFFTDEGGTKIAAISYLPFGNVAAGVGDIDQRCFGAHTFDTESGLYYMQRRHYDPGTARFLQPDPIAVLRPEKYLTVPRAYQPYAYVGNDPMNNADPSGLSFWSVVGMFVGAMAAPMVLGAALVGGLIGGLLTLAGVVSVAYVVADAAGGSALGEFARGFMIGLNAGLNLALGGGPAALVAPFFALEAEEFNHEGMKPVLGWSNWFLPMSWIANGVGLAFFLVNVIAAAPAMGKPWSKASITTIKLDWATGTIVTQGGVTEPMAGASGYNLGTFMYIHRNSSVSPRGVVVAHEAGHALNVAAYGGIFHFIGAIDENVWPFARGGRALAELYAESNTPAKWQVWPTGFSGTDPTAWWMVWV